MIRTDENDGRDVGAAEHKRHFDNACLNNAKPAGNQAEKESTGIGYRPALLRFKTEMIQATIRLVTRFVGFSVDDTPLFGLQIPGKLYHPSFTPKVAEPQPNRTTSS